MKAKKSHFSFHLSPSLLFLQLWRSRLWEITKKRFVRRCSCQSPTRSSWREKGAGGSTARPFYSQNIRLQPSSLNTHTSTHAAFFSVTEMQTTQTATRSREVEVHTLYDKTTVYLDCICAGRHPKSNCLFVMVQLKKLSSTHGQSKLL